MRGRSPTIAALAIGGLLVLTLHPEGALAATRYEAENATISQGVVESNHAGFSGTGFVNLDNVVGSYLQVTVNTESAGSANLSVRFANGTTANRPMDIAVNGTVVKTGQAFDPTGAWATWQSVSFTAPLQAGANTVRLTSAASTGGPNLDALDVDISAPSPGEVQAEDATISQGVVESNHAGYTGTGFVNLDNVVGSYVQFSAQSAEAGSAPLTFRFANGTTANRPMDITVNGTLVADDLAFDPTGAWTTWSEVTVNANLTAGANAIRATSSTANGGPNLDRLSVGNVGPPDTVAPSVPANPRVTGTTSSSISLAWDASTDNVGVSGYRVREGDNVVSSPAGTTSTISGLAPSTTHTYTVTARDAAGNESARSITVTGTTQTGQAGTPVELNGQLRVCGNRLCNKNGKQIQLRGMSTHGLQWYRNCVNDASMDALAGDWKADIIRLSMYIQEGGYETNPRMFTDLMHTLIEEASQRGVYVIVDWHMLSPGDPNYNLDRAKTFFTEIAQRHKDKTNILYEVANEPNGVSWSRIKSYHEQIIPVIRAQDPDSVILLGTRAWSSLGISDGASETEIINSPVNATNIMYTFHFYAASHGTEYLNALSRAADRIPMFVTEFGTQTASGDGSNNFTRSQQYIDLMATKKISWTNWNYSDDFRSGAVFKEGTCPGGPYTGTGPLKPAGVWVRDRTKTADDF